MKSLIGKTVVVTATVATLIGGSVYGYIKYEHIQFEKEANIKIAEYDSTYEDRVAKYNLRVEQRKDNCVYEAGTYGGSVNQILESVRECTAANAKALLVPKRYEACREKAVSPFDKVTCIADYGLF